MDEQNQKETPPNRTPLVFDPKDIEENKGVAALSYLFILFLVPLLTRKNSKFSQVHVKQGLMLCVLEIVATFFVWIPVLGWLLEGLILAVVIYAIIETLSGRYWCIPLIGPYAEKIKI